MEFTIDTSVARIIADYLNGEKTLPLQFADNRGIQLLLQGNHAPGLTPDSFVLNLNACRADNPQTIPVFKIAPNEVSNFLDGFEANLSDFCHEVTNLVKIHIPALDFACRSTMYVVFGGQTDAFAGYIDDQVHVAIELNSALHMEDSLSWIKAAACHEFWHVAFHNYIRHYWPVESPFEVLDQNYSLIFRMLDEGYAHYMGMLSFLGKEDSSLELKKNSVRFLHSFKEKIRVFISEKSSEEKARLVHESHIGNWDAKWGALTGALVISTLHMKFGHNRVLEAISKNPYEVWFLYNETVENALQLGDEFLYLVDATRSRIS